MWDLIAAFEIFEKHMLSLAMSLPRIYAFIAMSGILSTGVVPRLARNGAILILALPLVPVNMANISLIGDSLPALALYFAKEYAIGFLIGYMIGWIFWSVTSAGDFMDNQRGAAIASSIDPLQGQETTPLGNLFSQAFLTYMYSVGGILIIIGILYKSFMIWPVTRMLPIVSERFPVLILEILDLGMRTMFVLAAPVIALMFLSELALALVSRFAPQIQVFILSMGIKSGIATFVLVFYIKILFPYATEGQALFFENTNRLYEILEAGTDILSETAPRTGTEP
ncbi:yscT; putative type III secretion protein [Stappia aggregata IAM 12614]|uniref:YscT putative type III secretion protein n=1 Tax=Roseibium aggregatum (strain ATCC 25650 / DSM 13394 / JCM 20685 / NBRC 16684 / NCIMB 2208 / IAM 12614 / B1) TaxID=384765 RepID=A0P0L6_ROSAI|nr:type III secretion system export apparatus subunit SctT [Roseibium aggregatum]EAV41330.1 yscT; putative type III secretion protein [Stappia aggregata IAM 12614] [Roseibium aggregatum IAM 12614]